MSFDGKPHPHSFVQDGTDVRSTNVDVVEGKGINIKSTISGLQVLKSTNSQFHGFVQDEYTTLKETWDRILSTDVDASWHWSFLSLDQVKAAIPKFDAAFDAARDITLRTFAGDNSASVQNTMYKMAEQILAYEPLLLSVDYALPNKHYFQLGKRSSLLASIAPVLLFTYMLVTSRFELAQRAEEYRRGCRGVRALLRAKRPDHLLGCSKRWAVKIIEDGILCCFSKRENVHCVFKVGIRPRLIPCPANDGLYFVASSPSIIASIYASSFALEGNIYLIALSETKKTEIDLNR